MFSSFSLSRLGKLITKQFFENVRLYTYSVLALAGLLALAFVFWIVTGKPDFHEEITYVIFLIGLFIAGSAFASMSLTMLGSRDKGMYWLGVPATHLEKLVCTIFYTTIAFTAIYCLCFFLIKWIAVIAIKELVKQNHLLSYSSMNKSNSGGFSQAIPYLIYGFFAVQALYLLGSVYFSRYTFIITTVAGTVIFFVFVYYLTRIHDNMFGKVNWNWDIISVKKYDASIKNGYLLYSVSPFAADILKYAVQFAWAPLFWIITWFRLKEKEI